MCSYVLIKNDAQFKIKKKRAKNHTQKMQSPKFIQKKKIMPKK